MPMHIRLYKQRRKKNEKDTPCQGNMKKMMLCLCVELHQLPHCSRCQHPLGKQLATTRRRTPRSEQLAMRVEEREV